jgi:hypothetical protein
VTLKKALIVGIDDYSGSPLQGCVADAELMATLLERNDDASPNYGVRLLTSRLGRIERAGLRSQLGELFENARDNELLFYFAGHGGQTPWGAELVTQDFQPNSLGVSLNDVITLANETPAGEVVIIIDSCFAGDAGNIPGLQAAIIAPEYRSGVSVLGEGVTLLAAARATEGAAEAGGHGAFTKLIAEGLEGAATDVLGRVTSLSLYAFASRAFGAWEQRPVFKSHVTHPAVLRECHAWIDPQLLRKLPDYFPEPEARVRMTPDYEGDGRPLPPGVLGTSEQQAFDYFKKLRNAGLLSTDKESDLYFIAMGSGEVFLTATGRHFWTLASENRL